MPKRSYKSAVRDQAKAKTRQAIITAVVEVIRDDGVHAFSMQNVADKAGISLRTVYRYFETREALLEGLSDHVDAQMQVFGLTAPADLDEVEALIGPLYAYFASIDDALRASVVASIATGFRSPAYLARRATVHQMIADAFPHLDEQEVREAFAVINTLTGSRAWFAISAELGLGAEEGGSAVAWATKTLLAELRRRNEERGQA